MSPDIRRREHCAICAKQIIAPRHSAWLVRFFCHQHSTDPERDEMAIRRVGIKKARTTRAWAKQNAITASRSLRTSLTRAHRGVTQ